MCLCKRLFRPSTSAPTLPVYGRGVGEVLPVETPVPKTDTWSRPVSPSLSPGPRSPTVGGTICAPDGLGLGLSNKDEVKDSVLSKGTPYMGRREETNENDRTGRDSSREPLRVVQTPDPEAERPGPGEGPVRPGSFVFPSEEVQIRQSPRHDVP